MTVPKGALISHKQAGGGYGDPRERDPHQVWEDIVDRKISRAYAQKYYGFVCHAGDDGPRQSQEK